MGSESRVPLIAIVDDNESVREAIGSLVRSAGYQSALFESAEGFLSSGRTGEIDCLVADIHMPGLSGLELPRLLAEMNHSFPIIFVSARATEDVRARALKQGAFAFLRKPISDDNLLDTIQSALGSSGQ